MPALNNLAWALATCPDASLRNGAKAVQLARQANRLSDGKNPLVLRTLAAACADALRDPARLEAWRNAGARQVERFSEERVLDAFVRMLDGRPLDWQSFLSGGDGK